MVDIHRVSGSGIYTIFTWEYLTEYLLDPEMSIFLRFPAFLEINRPKSYQHTTSPEIVVRNILNHLLDVIRTMRTNDFVIRHFFGCPEVSRCVP